MNDAFLAWTGVIGWAVLHSIWQIALIYLIRQIVCFIWQKNAFYQYLASVSAMLAAFAAFLYTIYHETGQLVETSFTAQSLLPGHEIPATISVSPAPAPAPVYTLEAFFENNAWLVGLFWFALFLLFSIRLLGGYWQLRHTLMQATQPAPAYWQARCTHWQHRLGIRQRVRVLQSFRVSEPVAVGLFRPIVIFPAALLLQLPPDQLEALLLHELAHIRRYDYLVNILQLILEAVFFYHPLFWLLSRDARRRREDCCDDLVLRYIHDRQAYAQTLLTLKIQINSFTNHQLLMQMTGKSGFAARIRRIVEPQSQKAARPAILFPFLLLLAGALLRTETQAALLPNPSPYAIAMPERHSAPNIPIQTPKPVRPAPLSPGASISIDTTQPGQVAMELTKMNVLYIGVDNPLSLAVQGLDCNQLEARLLGKGALTLQGNCQYTVTVSQPGPVTIEVWSKTGQRLAVRSFRVKRIPDPMPVANFFRNSTLTLEEAASITEVKTLLFNFDFDAECEVAGFDMTLVQSPGSPVTRHINGARLDAGALDLIRTIQPGAVLFFEDVKCKCPGDAAVRHLGSVIYKITQ